MQCQYFFEIPAVLPLCWVLLLCHHSPEWNLKVNHLVRHLFIMQASWPPLSYHLLMEIKVAWTQSEIHCVSRHDALDLRGRCVHYSNDKCLPETHPAWIQKWGSSYQQNNEWLSSHCTELETCIRKLFWFFRTRGRTGTWKFQVKCICNGNTRQCLETQEGTEDTFQ